MRQRMRVDPDLTICYRKNNLMSAFNASCPAIDNEFRLYIVKVVRLVNPQLL